MKILMKFINEIDSEKILVRNFLDSFEKSKIIFEKFGPIRILNLKVDVVSQENEVTQESKDDEKEVVSKIVSFYSNLGRCKTVNVTPLIKNEKDLLNLQNVSQQVKKFINPSLIIFLGSLHSLEESRKFAKSIDYHFLDSLEYLQHSRLESEKYFADSLNKYIFQTKNEHIFLHLDIEQFFDQWQIILYSFKPIIKSIFISEMFKKKHFTFYENYKFPGKIIDYTPLNLNLSDLFFKMYQNQFIVYDGALPNSFQEFCKKKNFLVLDYKTVKNILCKYLDFQTVELTNEGKKI